MLWDLIDLVRRPFAALEDIDEFRKLPSGLVALTLSVLLPALASEIAGFGPFRPPANLGSLPALSAQGMDIYARWTYQHRFVLPIYAVAVSLVLWIVAAGLIHLVARALGGRGAFAGYLKLAGYIALVGLIAMPLDLLDALARLEGNARIDLSVGQVSTLLGIAIFLWQNLLLVYAARTHYRISTERAVAAVVGPIGIVAVLILVLVIVSVVLFVLSQRALS